MQPHRSASVGSSSATVRMLDRLNDELDRELGGSHRSSSARNTTGTHVFARPTQSILGAENPSGLKRSASSAAESIYSDNGSTANLSTVHVAARSAVRSAVTSSAYAGTAGALGGSPKTTQHRADEVSELRAALLAATHALHQAQRERKSEEHAAATARAERDDNARQVASLRAALERRELAAEQRAEQLQRKLDAAEAEKVEAQRLVTVASASLDNFQTRMDDATTRITSLSRDLEISRETAQTASQQRDELKAQLRSTTKRLRKIERFITDDAEQIAQRMQEFQAAARKLVRDRESRRESSDSALGHEHWKPTRKLPEPLGAARWSSDDDDSRDRLSAAAVTIRTLDERSRMGHSVASMLGDLVTGAADSSRCDPTEGAAINADYELARRKLLSHQQHR